MKLHAPSLSSKPSPRSPVSQTPSSPRPSAVTPRTGPEGTAPSKPGRTPSQGLFSSFFSPASRPGAQGPQSTGGSSFTPSRPQANPHLANPADVGAMRPQIAQQAQSNPSFYGTLVGGVNSALHQGGFGISPASHQSVMNNLQQVHAGTMSQGTAHFTEAAGFAQDAVNSFKHGRPLQGAVEASGVVLNTVGGVGMSFLQGLGRTSKGATPGELNGTAPW